MRRCLCIAANLVTLVPLVGCGGTGAPPAGAGAAQVQENRAAEGEEEALVEAILASQRAGFERGDVDAYIASWADDALFVLGRGPEPGAYDVRLSRGQLLAVRRMRLPQMAKQSRSFRWVEQDVVIDGESALLRVQSLISADGYEEREHERYRLRRTSDGWRIVENRVWPHSTKVKERATVYDAETWQRLDSEVDEARAAGDRQLLRDALAQAYRLTEAFAVSGEITSASPTAIDWMVHGALALATGEAEEAKKAYRAAVALDPSLAEYAPPLE